MVRRLLLLALLAPGVASAVTASIDRDRIEINESFTLTLVVEGDVNAEPDLSVLERDFYVLSRNQSSSTTIVNGRVSRSRTWVIALMAKQTGVLEVPPVSLGAESSEPLKVTVTPQTEAPPGEADIFLTAEVDSPRTWVQAQVIYTVKIFIGVSPRQPRLDQPEFDGVEVLVQPLGDDRRYESVIDDRTYTVLERRYALFPQASGTLEIGPTRFQARLWDRNRASGRKIFSSQPLSVEVLPIPAPPPGHPDAAWLPALAVSLAERWNPESGPVTAGEPVSREITLRATGLLGNQLPAVTPVEPPGFRAYPDQPEFETVAVGEGVQGMRKERYALVAAESGDIRFDPVELPWWDVRAGEWKFARLEPRSITVLPGATPPAPVESAPPTTGETASPRGDWWYRLSIVLAAGWLLTLIAWWYSLRSGRAPREPREAPRYRRAARKLKSAREACRRGDAPAAATALLEWAALHWPDNPPRSLGDLAARVPGGARTELEALNRVRYGQGDGQWDGAALAARLSEIARGTPASGPQRQDETLAPLYRT